MPFATGTWTEIGNAGAAGGFASPLNVAYSASQNVLLVGTCGGGPIFPFNDGVIRRSTDNGATWATVLDPEALGLPFHAPYAISLLRDPVTGAERFVAVVLRFEYSGTIHRGIGIQIWYADGDGLAWTPGSQLVDLPNPGSGAASFGMSNVATRPMGGPGTELEHYVLARGSTAVAETRGVFRSRDLGLTWEFVADPGAFGVSSLGSSVLVGLPDRALISSALGRSVDGGQTWQPGDPAFPSSAVAAFGGGPLVASRQATPTANLVTRISCDDGRSWPLGQDGPSYGISQGAATGIPIIIPLGGWEVLMAAAGSPFGTVEIVYSDTGGETEAGRASVDGGTGVIQHLSGGAVLADGRPIIVCGITGEVYRSSDVAAGAFGDRIYCVVAPAPGVGFPGFPPPCGDFYNPCPQDVPEDPAAIEGLLVAIPAPITLGDSWPFGDEELTYGDDEAIYGGDPNQVFSFPILGLPAGCGATFINEPCAQGVCP